MNLPFLPVVNSQVIGHSSVHSSLPTPNSCLGGASAVTYGSFVGIRTSGFPLGTAKLHCGRDLQLLYGFPKGDSWRDPS